MKCDEIRPENGSKIPNPTPLEFRNLSDYPPPLEFYSQNPESYPPRI